VAGGWAAGRLEHGKWAWLLFVESLLYPEGERR
jgi:hypothetical protein